MTTKIVAQLLTIIGATVLLHGCEATYYEYGSSAHVQKTFCPIDCDFNTAPFGKKGCRYEKQLTLLNARGEVVGGDEIQPNGDHVFNNPPYGTHVSDVIESWVKIEDSIAFDYEQLKSRPAKAQTERSPEPYTPPKPYTPPIDPERQKLITACIARFKADPNYRDAMVGGIEQTCAGAPGLKP